MKEELRGFGMDQELKAMNLIDLINYQEGSLENVIFITPFKSPFFRQVICFSFINIFSLFCTIQNLMVAKYKMRNLVGYSIHFP